MDMFRHHDITQHRKLVLLPHALEHPEKGIFVRCTLESRLTVIATEGYEMQVLAFVEPFQSHRHERSLLQASVRTLHNKIPGAPSFAFVAKGGLHEKPPPVKPKA